MIWLTGLAGSGKTTIGRLLHQRWKETAPNTVLVDGDEVRETLGLTGDETLYTLAGRRRVAERIAALCAWLDRQDLNVVCCTISLFEDLHESNRRSFSRYFEVFVDVPLSVLQRRDANGLYSRAQRGEIRNVMGVDLPFNPPAAPDMTIDNAEDRDELGPLADRILASATA